MNTKGKIHYHNSLGNAFKNKEYIVPIYRYISFDNLLQLLRSKTLWIGQTKLWDDTYENFLANAKYQWGPTPVTYRVFIDGFYGQCWTLKKESDAMWRIYSHDKTGVRIKSTIKKVLEASFNEINFEPFSTRVRTIGRVKYLNPKKICDWVNFQNCDLINNETLTESLFIKRSEFSHEKEIRLIVHKNHNQKDEINHLKIKIQPNELIDEITFDPRLDKEKYLNYKMVIEKMGFTNRINKSKLYEFKQIFISK
jgi:hypothetical protein